MFKIGQTSGVCTCCKPDAKPINCIKSYIAKMTKGMQDLPCACKAKTHVVQIAKGVFPCNKSECSSKVEDSTSQAKGCCGGGGCCGGSSCCGGGSKPASSTSISSGALVSGLQSAATSDMPDTTLLPRSVDGGTTSYYDNISRDALENDSAYNSAVAVASAAQTALNLVHAVSVGISRATDPASTVYKWAKTGILTPRGQPSRMPRVGIDPRPVSGVVSDIASVTRNAAVAATRAVRDATAPLTNPVGGSMNNTLSNIGSGSYSSGGQAAGGGFALGSTSVPTVSGIDYGIVSTAQHVAARVLDPVPSTIRDVLDSSYPQRFQDDLAVTQAYKTNFCDLRPFPECDACMYSTQRMDLNERDLYALLSGIQVGLDALNRGNVKWAEKCFMCPGQIAALLKRDLGPLGEIVGPAAAAAIIAATAVHGALHAYGSIAGEYNNSDLLFDLKRSVGKAICSGGCPPEYAGLMNAVLKDLDINTRDLFTTSPHTPSSATRLPGGSKDVPKSLQTINVDNSKRNNSSVARAAINNDRSAPSPESRAKAETVRSKVDTLYKTTESKVGDSPTAASKLTPSSTQDRKVATIDQLARPGVTYYRAVTPSNDTTGSTPASGKTTYKPIEVKAGENLEGARAKYENIFTDEDAQSKSPAASPSGGATSPVYTTTNDQIGKDDKKYYTKSGTGSQTPVTPTPTTKFDDTSAYYRKETTTTRPQGQGTPVTAYVKLKKVDSSTAIGPDEYVPGTTLVKDKDYTVYIGDPYVYTDVTHDLVGKMIEPYKKTHGEVYEQVGDPFDTTNRETLPESAPLVFDDGFVFAKPVPMDATAYEEIVTTPNLVTVSGIPASEMAQLNGIGLTVDEIKMAYVLDSVANASTVPYDVKAELIPTILDTFLDGY